MRYESIADIYSANKKIHNQFVETVTRISPEEAVATPDGEKWSIQQIIEHIAIVSGGIARICSKLVNEAVAAGGASDGSFALSQNFGEKAAVIAVTKVEAPDRVHPTGQVTIDQSLEQLAAAADAFDSIRAEMERTDLSGPTFPHPFFGELNAGEWLVMAGLHEQRHRSQIETLLTEIRQ